MSNTVVYLKKEERYSTLLIMLHSNFKRFLFFNKTNLWNKSV